MQSLSSDCSKQSGWIVVVTLPGWMRCSTRDLGKVPRCLLLDLELVLPTAVDGRNLHDLKHTIRLYFLGFGK